MMRHYDHSAPGLTKCQDADGSKSWRLKSPKEQHMSLGWSPMSGRNLPSWTGSLLGLGKNPYVLDLDFGASFYQSPATTVVSYRLWGATSKGCPHDLIRGAQPSATLRIFVLMLFVVVTTHITPSSSCRRDHWQPKVSRSKSVCPHAARTHTHTHTHTPSWNPNETHHLGSLALSLCPSQNWFQNEINSILESTGIDIVAFRNSQLRCISGEEQTKAKEQCHISPNSGLKYWNSMTQKYLFSTSGRSLIFFRSPNLKTLGSIKLQKT